MNEILTQAKENFQKALEHFKHELSTLRTSRASSGLLTTVTVESFGSRVPLEHIASISVPDARTLAISPWDKGQLGEIEKGILSANLGLTPSNDGSVIRISVPALTEDRRKDLVKMVGQMEEKARIAVRNVREEALRHAKKMEGQGDCSKDDLEKFQKTLQIQVEEINSKIKEVAEGKEKEVVTV